MPSFHVHTESSSSFREDSHTQQSCLLPISWVEWVEPSNFKVFLVILDTSMYHTLLCIYYSRLYIDTTTYLVECTCVCKVSYDTIQSKSGSSENHQHRRRRRLTRLFSPPLLPGIFNFEVLYRGVAILLINGISHGFSSSTKTRRKTSANSSEERSTTLYEWQQHYYR